MFSLCAVSVWPKTDHSCPAVDFDRLMNKAYLDSAYLKNSDNLPRIIYGADKMHIIIY